MFTRERLIDSMCMSIAERSLLTKSQEIIKVSLSPELYEWFDKFMNEQFAEKREITEFAISLMEKIQCLNAKNAQEPSEQNTD